MPDQLAKTVAGLAGSPARTTPKRARQRCGARTRSGAPCQAPAVWDRERNRPRNGRCRMHGGLSTGPRTPEGRARALANLRPRGTDLLVDHQVQAAHHLGGHLGPHLGLAPARAEAPERGIP